MPLHRALFIEPNPTGAKYALSLLGKGNNVLRKPLAYRQKIVRVP